MLSTREPCAMHTGQAEPMCQAAQVSNSPSSTTLWFPFSPMRRLKKKNDPARSAQPPGRPGRGSENLMNSALIPGRKRHKC